MPPEIPAEFTRVKLHLISKELEQLGIRHLGSASSNIALQSMHACTMSGVLTIRGTLLQTLAGATYLWQ